LSHGQNVTFAVPASRSGLPLRSARDLAHGCAMMTCGSFWNVAASVMTGRFSSIALIAWISKLRHRSVTPETSSCMALTCGPPMEMVTSRPSFAYSPSASAW
jgi:hypothetical protein